MVQGALLSLEVLKQSYKFANLHKVNFAACFIMYSSIEGGAKSYCNITSLTLWSPAKILLADFNLAVSIPTAKLPNLIPVKFSGCTVFVFSQELFMFAMYDLT